MARGNEQLELPAGFRFHPTDEELVIHYLCRKCAALPIFVPIIKDLDLYKFDPWLLPEMAVYGEKEWYFFTPRDRKYPNGSRPNRAAGTGYWKATGADKQIGKPKSLGIKKALVFYSGKAPKGIKTNWIMHEYRLANVDRSAGKNNNLRLDDWVLCRIYNKKGIIDKKNNNTLGQNQVHNFSEIEHEIVSSSPINPHQGFFNNQIIKMSADSIPKLNTDSGSCSSEHMLSSEVTWDKEVQSEFDLGGLTEDAFVFSEDPFGSEADQFQIDLQLYPDMFMLS